jgi:ATP-dependent HslUV protease subunit HslV
MKPQFHGTTILAVKKDGRIAMGGDGQLSLEDTIVKHRGHKVRLLSDGKVLAGYAGAAADALALLDIFEGKLKQYNGDLTRSVIEVAKEWRLDRNLRRLEADIVVADTEKMFLVSGQGEIIEPDEDIIALGSGGAYAQAAATALLKHTVMTARAIVEASMKIASEICVYTNSFVTIEEIAG